MWTCKPLGSGHLPVIFAIIFFVNLCLTYTFAVIRSDVDAVFPYVSATGDHRPESCLFSLLLNLSSFLSAMIIYLRYALIDTLYRQSDNSVERVNLCSFYVGLGGAFAMMMVANFQETAIISVHLTAAFFTFGLSVTYMFMQAWLTIHMHPFYCNRRIGFIRLAIAIITTLSFISALVFGILAAHVYHLTYPNLPTPRPWSRKYWQPGYEFHVVSAISEWIMSIGIASFLLSYSRDFEKLRVEVDFATMVHHLDHSPLFRSLDDINNF